MQRAECLPQNTGTYQPLFVSKAQATSSLKEPSLENTALLVKRQEEEQRRQREREGGFVAPQRKDGIKNDIKKVCLGMSRCIMGRGNDHLWCTYQGRWTAACICRNEMLRRAQERNRQNSIKFNTSPDAYWSVLLFWKIHHKYALAIKTGTYRIQKAP